MHEIHLLPSHAVSAARHGGAAQAPRRLGGAAERALRSEERRGGVSILYRPARLRRGARLRRDRRQRAPSNRLWNDAGAEPHCQRAHPAHPARQDRHRRARAAAGEQPDQHRRRIRDARQPVEGPHHHRLRARHRQRVSRHRHQSLLFARALPGSARPHRRRLEQARPVRVRGRALQSALRQSVAAPVPDAASADLDSLDGVVGNDPLGWASPVYVADTDERAREEARAGMESLFNDFLAVPWEMLMPPGYTSLSSMKNTMRMRKALGARKRHSLEELMDSGTVVVGSPRTVRDELERLREQTGANHLVTMLRFGVLSDELTRRNMELFAAEVMPHLRG